MGEFFDSIKGDLDKLDQDELDAVFGVDFDTNKNVVSAAQSKINGEGYTPALVVDGDYGPKTKAGISWYQGRHGLSVNGTLDPNTLKKMGIAVPSGGSGAALTSTAYGEDWGALVAFAAKYKQKITQASGIASGFQYTRASVAASFVDWSKALEGYTLFPYTDEHGYVTIAMGNLIDSGPHGAGCGNGTRTPCGSPTPTAAARALPWEGGSIDADWAAIKQAWPDVQSLACANITTGRISPAAAQDLIWSRMKANEKDLASGLTTFAKAPADAQLAVHGMAWAMGSGFAHSWTQFRAAFNAEDYAGAAAQSHIGGADISMRNNAHKLLLLNADAVVKRNLNRDHLYYVDGITQLAAMSWASRVLANAKAHPARTAGIAAAVAAAVTAAAKIFGGK